MKLNYIINSNFSDGASNWCNYGYSEPSELAIKVMKDRLRDKIGRESNMEKGKIKTRDIAQLKLFKDGEWTDWIDVRAFNPNKSLFEQALALLELEIGEEFMFTPRKDGLYPNRYKFDDDCLWIYAEGISRWDCSGISLEIILKLPQNVSKATPLIKPKSEAELILDELAKVVDKAEDILRRSGR